MELLGGFLKLAHIVAAMAMLTGLVGSRLLNRRASRSEDIENVWRLTRAAAPFDRLTSGGGPLVILTGLLAAWAYRYPWLGLTTGWILLSSVLILTLIPLIPLVYAPAGARVEAEIEAARATGSVTPALRAAYDETGLRRVAGWYGNLVTPVIVALMVLKPF